MQLTVFCKLGIDDIFCDKHSVMLASGNYVKSVTSSGITKNLAKIKTIAYWGKSNITVAVIDSEFLSNRKYYYNANGYGDKSDIIYIKLSEGNTLLDHLTMVGKQFNSISEYYESTN